MRGRVTTKGWERGDRMQGVGVVREIGAVSVVGEETQECRDEVAVAGT